MQVKILIFGRLADIVNDHELTLIDMPDTNNVVNELNKRYPALAQSRYVMAVDKQTITTNTDLKDGSTVALLPPFSGG
jgi:molybdopterin synthase sulfur carrier subunit